jgi:3-oxoadipate enol-lactonase
MDFRASTPTITAPTMVIVGSSDPATLPEYGAEIQKMIKGSKIVSLDAAHLSNIEQPKAYTDAVLNFLKN